MPILVFVANTHDLKPGEMKKVVAGEQTLVLFNVDGSFYALTDRCTHDEASLSEGLFEDGVVECPKHGARFNVKTGKILSLPAVLPPQVYEVKIEGDQIFIEI